MIFLTKWTEVIIPLRPKPSPRPRVKKNGWTYLPRSYMEHKKQLITTIKSKIQTQTETIREALYHIKIETICKQPKKSRFKVPNYDCDNVAKTVLDAVSESKRLWYDDTQVVSLKVNKRYGSENKYIIKWTSSNLES